MTTHNDDDLPAELRVCMTQENDRGEVTFVTLESTGRTISASEYAAAVDRWRRGLPRTVRTRVGKDQIPHIRALRAAHEAVEDAVPDAEVQARLMDRITSKIAEEFSLDEKSIKDMLSRYRRQRRG
jgi:hypothetical protein